MIALPLKALATESSRTGASRSGEPVALLQLDLADAVDAATAVYREVRRGRRVVAVAAGHPDASARLADALDAIGVDAIRPAAGDWLLDHDVAIVPGPEIARSRPRRVPDRVIRVGLAGCGVVGGGVLQRLQGDPRFAVVGVLVRDPGKLRDMRIADRLLVADPGTLLAREPDVVIDALSDASTGLALTRASLVRGLHVISANKQAIGGDLPGLVHLATVANVQLLYSASVGGGAPLIETARRAARHGEIVRIEAVLNGTCNFILNRLANGDGFNAALAEARDAGFAEADPSADLTGADAAAKLAILAHEGLEATLPIASIARVGLSAHSALPAGVVRQVARIDLGQRYAGITLEAVDGDPLFTHLPDETNALRVTLADGRVFETTGRGAGRRPTVESVWADLCDLASAISPPQTGHRRR